MNSNQWERPIEANIDIDSPEWEWVKTPLIQVMAEVEKWNVHTRLLTVERRGNVVEVKAHYPFGHRWDDQRWIDAGCSSSKPPTFESEEWCAECRRRIDEPHDVSCCKVHRVMES